MSVSSDQPLLANQLPISLEIPLPTDAEFVPVLSLLLKKMIDTVNTKEGSLYLPQEIANFMKLYGSSTDPQTFRNGYRKLFIIGAIAAGATSTTAHGITSLTQIIHRSGEAITAVPDFRSIPYASATLVTDQIQLTIDGTNIVIVNGATAPNITSAVVWFDYVKN